MFKNTMRRMKLSREEFEVLCERLQYVSEYGRFEIDGKGQIDIVTNHDASGNVILQVVNRNKNDTIDYTS